MRDSNMEALRIFAMSCILTAHFIIKGHADNYLLYDAAMMFLPFTSIGVVVFVMLSGWFSVRASFRNALKLIALVFFYMMLGHLGLWAVGYELDMAHVLKSLIFPLSTSWYWFISMYLFIMIIAPVINPGLDGLDNRRLTILVGSLTFFNAVMCFMGDNELAFSGHGIAQGLWFYVTGYWLRRNREQFSRVRARWYLLAYVAVALVGSIGFVVTKDINWVWNHAPVPYFCGVAIFLFFMKLQFRSRIINYIAGAALGCYLLQDGDFSGYWMYEWIGERFDDAMSGMSLMTKVGYMALTGTINLIGFWMLSLVLTPVANRFSGFVCSLAEKAKTGFARLKLKNT